MRPILVFFGLLISLVSFCQIKSKDRIVVLPGMGLIFNGDSIFLFRTTIPELGNILKIDTKEHRLKGQVDLPTLYDGVSFDGKSTSWSEWNRNITYKNIEFQYASETNRDSMTIKWITIKNDTSINVDLGDSIRLGDFNPSISRLYPSIGKRDYVSKDGKTFNLYSYGLSYHLIFKNDVSQLVELSIHQKIKE